MNKSKIVLIRAVVCILALLIGNTALAAPKTIRILSLNGGGVRSIITLQVLRYLEETTGKPISKLFDFVACTSSGCIIAAQLLAPDEHGNPKYSANQIIELYRSQSKSIFANPWYHKIITLNGYLAPEYSNRIKRRKLKKIFGDSTLNQLLLPTIITTYSVKHRKIRLFYSRSPEAQNYYLWSIINAATSPPGYFASVIVRSIDHKHSDTLVDGAIFANNPSILAWSAVSDQHPGSKYILVSIGAGQHVPAVTRTEAIHWGKLQWIRDLLIMSFNAQTLIANDILSTMSSDNSKLDYYYFDIPISTESAAIDNTSRANIKQLNEYGKRLVNSEKSRLDKLAKQLSQQ